MPVHSLGWMTAKQLYLQRRKPAERPRKKLLQRPPSPTVPIHPCFWLPTPLSLFLPLSLLSASVSSSPANLSVLLPDPLFLAIPTCLDGASLFLSLRLCPAPWPYFSFLQPCSTVHGSRKQQVSMGQMSAHPMLISEVKWGEMGA